MRFHDLVQQAGQGLWHGAGRAVGEIGWAVLFEEVVDELPGMRVDHRPPHARIEIRLRALLETLEADDPQGGADFWGDLTLAPGSVLPAPGARVNKRLGPPAAAIFRARLPALDLALSGQSPMRSAVQGWASAARRHQGWCAIASGASGPAPACVAGGALLPALRLKHQGRRSPRPVSATSPWAPPHLRSTSGSAGGGTPSRSD